MAVLATPEQFSPELSSNRLSIVGELMLDVLAQAMAATSTQYDCAYSRAVLPWAWIKNALLQLAQSREHDWLSIKHAGNDLVIAIGDNPIRFFIDDHINPRKVRVLSPTEGEAAQLAFDFATHSDSTPALWRFIVERAMNDDTENRVFFVGYNVTSEIVAKWEFTESVRAFHATDAIVPAAVQLDPIALAPIYEQAPGHEGLQSDDDESTHERRAG
jgi:hypothetical protein